MNPDDRMHAKPIPSHSIRRFRRPSVVSIILKLALLVGVLYGLAWGARTIGWLPAGWWPF